MAYRNSASAKTPTPLPIEEYHIDTPLEEYDLNFQFDVKVLESNGVRLEPFIPSLHARKVWETLSTEKGPRLYRFFPFNVPNSFAKFLTDSEVRRRNPDWVDFVIFDKSKPGHPIGGMISFLNTEKINLATEIGAVLIFPEAQRTHVTTHANGLLLKYCFEELGLRRVQWRANIANKASVGAAERLGFDMEGVIRWHRILPAGKEGITLTDTQGLGSPEAGVGRHTATLAVTWDTWKDSVREHINGLMAREVKIQN